LELIESERNIAAYGKSGDFQNRNQQKDLPFSGLYWVKQLPGHTSTTKVL